MWGRDLQVNDEADNMDQDDHIRPSGPWLDNVYDVSSQSLSNPHIVDEVNMEELHGPPTNRHEELLSSEWEYEVEYEYAISILIYFLQILWLFVVVNYMSSQQYTILEVIDMVWGHWPCHGLNCVVMIVWRG